VIIYKKCTMISFIFFITIFNVNEWGQFFYILWITICKCYTIITIIIMWTSLPRRLNKFIYTTQFFYHPLVVLKFKLFAELAPPRVLVAATVVLSVEYKMNQILLQLFQFNAFFYIWKPFCTKIIPEKSSVTWHFFKSHIFDNLGATWGHPSIISQHVWIKTFQNKLFLSFYCIYLDFLVSKNWK